LNYCHPLHYHREQQSTKMFSPHEIPWELDTELGRMAEEFTVRCSTHVAFGYESENGSIMNEAGTYLAIDITQMSLCSGQDRHFSCTNHENAFNTKNLIWHTRLPAIPRAVVRNDSLSRMQTLMDWETGRRLRLSYNAYLRVLNRISLYFIKWLHGQLPHYSRHEGRLADFVALSGDLERSGLLGALSAI